MTIRFGAIFSGLLLLALSAAGVERPNLQTERAWTVGPLVAITPDGSLPAALEWRSVPKVANSRGEIETGGILTQVFIDRRGRLRVLTMQGGTESEKEVLRGALRAAKVNIKFPAEASTGTKAWFATYFAAVCPDRNNTCAVVKRLTPVFLDRELRAGRIQERRLRVLVHPTGVASVVSDAKVEPDVAAAIGEAFKEWEFIPPLVKGVAGYAEIDVPLLFALGPARTGFTTPATVIQQTSVVRSRWLRLRNIGDYYRVRITIGKDGKVGEAALLDPTSSQEFNEAVVRETKTWRFSPAVRNGVAVESTTILAFGRPPPPPAPVAEAPAGGKHEEVVPPHARRVAARPLPPARSAMQVRVTIDKTGAVSDSLIERAENLDDAVALVGHHRDSQWDSATANGAATEYSFRVRR